MNALNQSFFTAWGVGQSLFARQLQAREGTETFYNHNSQQLTWIARFRSFSFNSLKITIQAFTGQDQ
jgi:hypothetical protein